MPPEDLPDPNLPHADAGWFRDPDRRENTIAGLLFLGFGVFFVMQFLLQRGWWFRWVILGLGVISILRGAGHLIDAIRRKN